jgi:signal transduction histidine kinase/DNA-binding response OmpR family regulator
VEDKRPDAQRGFLAGGGEMGVLLRTRDWTGSPLGTPDRWPQSLKTAVRIMLTSRQPIWVGWGRELTFFYNDAYKAIIGGKHPWALGRPTSEVWREIWGDIETMLATAMGGIEGTYVEEQLLIMERNGYPEETYYTFSYSPIPDDDGRPGGIICANTDDTKRVIGERQLALLRDLSTATADTRSWRDVCENAAAAFGSNPHDLPFALIYMADSDGHGPAHDSAGQILTLMGSAGIRAGHPAAPATVALDGPTPWPFGTVVRRHEIHVVAARAEEVGATQPTAATQPAAATLPTGAWSEPVSQVALLPVLPGGETGKRGVLVVGLNPYRLFDGNYRDFLALVAGQLAAAVANADAYEQERRRAESLAEIDRVKTRFFSNVSHEFRTPLTLMLGPLEESLADAARLLPRERERLQLVHRNGMRLLKLVNSLLDFSRIEAGRTRANFEPTNLAALTADVASNFRSATERAGLWLKIECPEDLPSVYVDRDLWEKVVLNLLSNAFKFTFEGGITVSVQHRGAVMEMCVEDTGTGIAASELPRLFERFHRIEGARGRSFEGSGIGLALVKELVETHGGSIHVESEEGRGTTFRVAVPLGRTHLPPGQVRSERALGSSGVAAQAFVEEALRWLPRGTPPSEDLADTPVIAAEPVGRTTLPKSRILLADDNADMRDYISQLLGSRHECVATEDGRSALALIRERRPDLLLTDIMMPHMDGFALIKAIREDVQLRDLPIIVISARAGEESSVEGLAAGADDYLVKPFSARELIARVDGALAMARVRREMGEALREEARSLEILNRVGAAVAAELDLHAATQLVTDAATELTGAAYGAFFFNADDGSQSFNAFAFSGAAREMFADLSMPQSKSRFASALTGDSVVRSDDLPSDPGHGPSDHPFGTAQGRLPVRSYLTARVVSRSGEILGVLFFGHPEPGVFTARAERLLAGIAAQAAIAIDNARLYQAAQREIEVRARTEAALRESEERQIRLNQSLEELVAARTAELAHANAELRAEAEERAKVEQALRQSQKMEAVGKLTGGVAHDFNNLLQVIGGNLQLLVKDLAGSDKAEQRLRNALAGVSRGSKLASQLLAFGRRQPLAPKVVNLGRFIRGLDDLLRRALGDGVEIETVISGGLWHTLVDPSQVENALLNLAINARDAMDGHGRLTIEAGNAALTDDYVAHHADVQPGQYVMLAVTDTGCGMTPHVIEHAFEPFFTTKPEGQGTGLGLSMVYGFVRQSGGHIKVYSESGQGTTIRIYLPRAFGAEDVTTEVDAGPISGGTETVLVVEDDEEVRATVCELLADLGYRVLKARDAQNALAIVDSGVAIDLLFTDVVMPGPLRSPELARHARARLPDVAVLFTSGYTDNAIVHGGRLDQGIELLSKPYTREALARKIRHVLRGQRQREAARPAEARAKDAPRPANGQRARRMKVLFVEDDELIRMATADLLESLGHAVFEAADAPKALNILDNTRIDVLMTDVGLPGMSGARLAAEARRADPTIKVIFATGADGVPDLEDPAAREHAFLLRKPYDIAALEQVLRAVGEGRGAGAAASE